MTQPHPEHVSIRCSTPGHSERMAVRYLSTTRSRLCAECVREGKP